MNGLSSCSWWTTRATTTLPTASTRSSTTSTPLSRTPCRVSNPHRAPLPLHVLTSPSAFTKPPFACSNEGWGEFEMDIDCYYTEKTKLTLKHDLNFQQNRYESVQAVSFKNPSQALQEKLRELGPLPDDDARPKKKGVAGKKSSSQKYDFEKIAEALEKLEEDDLLKIIQMINDHKSADTYIKSDVEGEFLSLVLGVLQFWRDPFPLFPGPGASFFFPMWDHPDGLKIC